MIVANAAEESIISTNSDRSKWRKTAILLLIALLIEVYFIIYDIPFLGQDRPAIDTPPIADLVTSKNTVRVQDPGELVWGETTQGQRLHQRQSLLTLERSRAELAMLDGSGIEVDENSLITLESIDESAGDIPVIRIHRGGIRRTKSGKTGQALQILVGNHSLVASPDAELRVIAGPEGVGGRAEVIVDEGRVTLDPTPGMSELTLKAGQEMMLGEGRSRSGEIRSAGLSVQGPAGGDLIESDKGTATVRFRWRIHDSAPAGTPLELEVSRDPTFQKDVSTLRIAATEPPLKYVDTKITLPTGKEAALWHWRVRPVGSRPDQNSRTENFWVKPTVTESEKALPIIQGSVGSGPLTPPLLVSPAIAPKPVSKQYSKPIAQPKKPKKKEKEKPKKAKAPGKPAMKQAKMPAPKLKPIKLVPAPRKAPPPPPDELNAVIVPKPGGKK